MYEVGPRDISYSDLSRDDLAYELLSNGRNWSPNNWVFIHYLSLECPMVLINGYHEERYYNFVLLISPIIQWTCCVYPSTIVIRPPLYKVINIVWPILCLFSSLTQCQCHNLRRVPTVFLHKPVQHEGHPAMTHGHTSVNMDLNHVISRKTTRQSGLYRKWR